MDVNRDPTGVSLYPGQATTGLCPTTTFGGQPVDRRGAEFTPDKVADRRSGWFYPHHRAHAH